jgi:hypothetical protein
LTATDKTTNAGFHRSTVGRGHLRICAMDSRAPRFSLLALAPAAWVLVSCGLLPFAGGGAGSARACDAVYSLERCQAMLTAAAESLGVAEEDVASIEIAPEPTPRSDGILEIRSGSRPIEVLAHVGGVVRTVPMCFGIPSGPQCMDRPAWEISSSVGAGYEDVPCPGEPPDGCATPLPAVDPTARAGAQQLRIDDRVIPVSAVGRQEVRLGTAVLPNGILTVAHGQLGDPWPDLVRFSSAGISLEVRSLVHGRPPFSNSYEHGWWPGTEEVEVFLVFEARHVEPGATIEIRNLVVG